MSVRVCTKCAEEKPLDEFATNRKTRTGKASWCKPCMRAYSQARYQANKDLWRDTHYSNKYGISLAEFEGMRSRQGDRCACCGKKARLVVDHCHGTGIVRGLLCSGCNTGIGQLGDNEEGLLRALRYVRESCT